jgi:Protein of unknown function (DUF3237)
MLAYDAALIRETPAFLAALSTGGETSFSDQYMRMIPEFDTGDDRNAWLTEHLFLAEGRLSAAHQLEYEVQGVD